MSVIIKAELVNEEWWCWADIGSNNINIFIFNHEPSEEEVQPMVDEYLNVHSLDTTVTAAFSIYDRSDLLKLIIQKFKATPGMNKTQYDAYLATLPWQDAYLIRYFIYRLAVHASQYYQLQTNWTEADIITKVKTWILATPNNKLSKIIFGTLTDI